MAGFDAWEKYRGSKFREPSAVRMLNKALKVGADRYAAAMDEAIERGWTGVYPDGHEHKNGKALFPEQGETAAQRDVRKTRERNRANVAEEYACALKNGDSPARLAKLAAECRYFQLDPDKIKAAP
jgi:hypothetical protein